MATIILTTFTPLHGDAFDVETDSDAFARVLARYRTLYPLDTRDFNEMSSDIQHAIIRATTKEN